MLHLIITILLGVITLLFGVMTFYALKRITIYENIILNINNTIETINRQLKLIDDKGHFESDDEVGFVFEEVKILQTSLSELFEKENRENSNSVEKTEKN